MSTIQLNERALQALGMDRVTIEALRHLVRQVGQKPGAITLPEVAEQTDILNPVLVALQLADAAIQAQAAILEAEQSNLPQPDREARQLLDDLAAELQEQRLNADRLSQQVDDLTAALQGAHMTNDALERRISDLENGVN